MLQLFSRINVRSLCKTIDNVRQVEYSFCVINDRHTDISKALARNLISTRQRMGLSLSELASKAGIGKATLSVLESGNGNPNIETMWAIANALEVPFGQLMDTTNPEFRLVKKGRGIRVETGDEKMEAELLVSSLRKGAFEIYNLHLKKGCERNANAHARGTMEHVLVKKGTLVTGTVEDPSTVKAGELVSFMADCSHVYKAPHGDVIAIIVADYL